MKAFLFCVLSICLTASLPAQTARQLDSVVIKGRKPLFQQQPFGTVVNVESSVLTKGSTALQLLERSPGVTVDHRYNSIALDGKSGVTVSINGKIMHLSMDQVVSLLNGMPADGIEKIELMTTPPSKYDAEGNAGLINIVLKKNTRPGATGSLSLTQGYGWGEKDMAVLSFADNTKKIGVYGDYTFMHNRSYNNLFGEGYENFPTLGGPMDVQFQNTTKPLQNNHDARLGIDTRLDKKTSAGASIGFNSLNSSSSGYNHRLFTILPDSPLYFDGTIKAANHWTNLNPSIYLERNPGPGEKLSADLDYLYYRNNNPTDVVSSFLNKEGEHAGANNDTLFAPHQQGFAHTLIRVGVAKLDYQKQIGKKLRLETGIKGTYTSSRSASAIQSLIAGNWISRTETTNDMRMKEGIGAAYMSADLRLSASASLTAGVRYEYSRTRMDDAVTGANTVDRKLGVFFPSLFFSKKINDHSGWQFSYTKRISRPAYNDLSSFVAYNDPITVFTGNQFLKPAITNTIKAGYHYRGFSFSLSAGRDDDPIARYQLTASPAMDLMYISPQNLDYQNNLDFQADLPWRINSWWSMSYSVSGGWRRFRERYTPLPVEKTWFGYSLHGSEVFTLPKNLTLEVSGWYNSSSYDGTVKTLGFGTIDIGIKKELGKSGGILQLSATDLFKTIKYKNYYGALTPDVFDGHSWVTYNPESRQWPILRLSWSRSFGTGASKPKRGSGSQEEQLRIKEN